MQTGGSRTRQRVPCGRSSNTTLTCPLCGSGWTEPTSLMFNPKPDAVRKRRYWSPGLDSPMYIGTFHRAFEGSGVDCYGSESRIVWTMRGALGATFACASVHALCPSAASGLTVKPGGRVTTVDCSADGVAANPSGCGFCSTMSSPDGASASLVVGPAKRTGLKVSFSQPVVLGYVVSARDRWFGSW